MQEEVGERRHETHYVHLDTCINNRRDFSGLTANDAEIPGGRYFNYATDFLTINDVSAHAPLNSQ
jgi:hypothetical protein